MELVDAIATIVLFVALLGWVWLAFLLTLASAMMSDQGAPGIAVVGVALGVLGTPVTAVSVYLYAVVLAWRADGYTFYYPLVACLAGSLLVALVLILAFSLVRLGQRMHGLDTDRRPTTATTPEPRAPELRAAESDSGTASYVVHRVHETRFGRPIVLGVERTTGRRYIRVPLSYRDGEYEQYRALKTAVYELFLDDPVAAEKFAEQCEAGGHRQTILPIPGARVRRNVGPHRKLLRRKLAILFTDTPLDIAGQPVAGFPHGYPYVRILDNRTDAQGNLRVALLGDDSREFVIDARQLGT
jgi:hypothetical protein